MRNSERNDLKEVLRRLVSERIKARPKRITLHLSWGIRNPALGYWGDGLD